MSGSRATLTLAVLTALVGLSLACARTTEPSIDPSEASRHLAALLLADEASAGCLQAELATRPDLASFVDVASGSVAAEQWPVLGGAVRRCIDADQLSRTVARLLAAEAEPDEAACLAEAFGTASGSGQDALLVWVVAPGSVDRRDLPSMAEQLGALAQDCGLDDLAIALEEPEASPRGDRVPLSPTVSLGEAVELDGDGN